MILASGAKTGTLAGAALETAGIALQSDFLNLVSGESFQLLAGLFYLVAISTAVITVAIGGSYKWARYLLVGPALFFFLTEVRTSSEGSKWAFGDVEYVSYARDQALQGVNKFGEDGRPESLSSVSIVFKIWNVMMSDITQVLVGQVSSKEGETNFNFLSKVDRYLSQWKQSQLKDNNIRLLINEVLIPDCSQYFSDKMIRASKLSTEEMQNNARENLEGSDKQFIRTFMTGESAHYDQLIKDGVLLEGEAMNCDQMWERMVLYLRVLFTERLPNEIMKDAHEGQNPNEILKIYLQKHATSVGRATGDVTLGDEDPESFDFNGLLAEAVDRVIARSLFIEMYESTSLAASFEFKAKPEKVFNSVGNGSGRSIDSQDVADSMAEFNVAKKYEFRATYVNAAMAMPYFQGVLLFLLAAAYPFFALMVIIPGRAASILSWFGLWAWVKLWDLGFAIVMMIDDMLYTMFPKSPSFNSAQSQTTEGVRESILDPGFAWSRILENDPVYSEATYYNLISTCLFAVPLVTGLLVKGGASELVNITQGSWSAQASRLGQSAGEFVASLKVNDLLRQAKVGAHDQGLKRLKAAEGGTYNARLVKNIATLQNYKETINKVGLGGVSQAISNYSPLFGALSSKLGGVTKAGANAVIDEEIAMLQRSRRSHLEAEYYDGAYQFSISRKKGEGFDLSNRAVALGYSSHHFNEANPWKYKLEFQASRVRDKDGLEGMLASYESKKKELLENKNLTEKEKEQLRGDMDKLRPAVSSSSGDLGFNATFINYNDVLGKIYNSAISEGKKSL